jgi:hypothetical protein
MISKYLRITLLTFCIISFFFCDNVIAKESLILLFQSKMDSRHLPTASELQFIGIGCLTIFL